MRRLVVKSDEEHWLDGEKIQDQVGKITDAQEGYQRGVGFE